jgi:hypothetical protein
VVPFAILMTADWILNEYNTFKKRYLWTVRLILFSFIFLCLDFIIIQPLYYSSNSVALFSETLKKEATKIQPWPRWQIELLDPQTRVLFYLHLPPTTLNRSIIGKRETQTKESLLKAWPLLQNQSDPIIFVTRQEYVPLLRPLLKGYLMVEAKEDWIQHYFKIHDVDAPVAFIPIKKSIQISSSHV